MEILIIERAFIISLIVIALWCCFLPGMIFEKINYLRIYNSIKKPIFECPVCMVFWYGTVIYWSVFHAGILDWMLVIGVSMGFATFFVKIKKD